jgi:Zn-dependent M32 family carboxypeptidase
MDNFEGTYEKKVQDIKKRKRSLRHVQDSKMVKKMKADLKREQRGIKRKDKHDLKNWLKEEVNKNGYDF